MERVSKAGPSFQKRFAQNCVDYFRTVVNEARLRDNDKVFEIDEYLLHRRDNGGVKPCFDLFEYVLGFDLPEHVFDDDDFMECHHSSNDLVCLANVSLFLFQ